MRRILIKVWPEIRDQFPAIIPYERFLKSKDNVFVLDLGNTLNVESSALNILLLNLIKLLANLNDKKWDIIYPKDEVLDKKIRDLGFYKLLSKNAPNENLFWQDENLRLVDNLPSMKITENSRISVFPIYELDFISAKNPRSIVDVFKDYLIDNLLYLNYKYSFNLSVFIQILTEMAKNSADHTNSNAYFGLDIEETNKTLELKFSFGDLGIGVNQSIRNFIKDDEAFNKKEKHLALTDAYHYALQIGNTTKTNSVNKGIGMASIYELSRQMNFTLSVYDANSRGLLSCANNITHTELRKVFFDVGFKVGFHYYGTFNLI